MNDHDRHSEIDRLLVELVDGKLTPRDEECLWAMLREDPSARTRYADYLLLDANLAWECAWRADAPDGGASGQSVEECGSSRVWPGAAQARGKAAWSRSRGERLRWAVAIACVMVGMGSLVVAVGRWLRPVAAPTVAATSRDSRELWLDPEESKAGGVAILTRAVDVIWEEGGPAPVIGSALATEVLRIRSGVLQLEFYGGVTLVAEGPAEIELKAIDRIACRSGKLRARVPPSARGFRVDSPAVDLVDLGTEFGMRIVPGQKSEVHVFDGKVELYETGSPSGRAAKWELSEGHGVRIGIAGEVTPLVSDPPAFLAPPRARAPLPQGIA